MKNAWSIDVRTDYYLKVPEKAELCGDDTELSYAYDHLLFQWTSIEAFIREITHFLTDLTFFEKEPIVNIIIRKGLKAYQRLLVEDNDELRPHDRLMTFFLAVFNKIRILCTFTVKDASTGETWNVLNDSPLTLWRYNRTKLSIEKDKIDESDVACAIYNKTLPRNIKLAMRRHQHENTILAGDLGLIS